VQPTSQQRDGAIDLIRGLAIAVMMIDHLPANPWQKLTYQPLGFFTAALVFVFLSGYVGAWRLTLRADRRGWDVARKGICRRIVLLMAAHHGIATVAALAAALLGRSYSAEIQTLLPRYAASPLAAWSLEMIFVNQTVYLDILTLYVVLLPVLVLAIRCFRGGRVAPVLMASAAVWVGVQFDLVPDVVERANRFSTNNLLAWQFLFVIASWLGYRRARGLSFAFTSHPAWKMATGVAFVTIFATRHLAVRVAELGSSAEEAPGYCTHALNWIPLCSFLTAVAAYGAIPTAWKEAAVARTSVLVTMGQNSLGLFLAHFALSYGIWFEYAGLDSGQLTRLDYFGIPFLAVAFLLLLGQTLAMRRSGAEAPRKLKLAPQVTCR
jgi:hypothetical protein